MLENVVGHTFNRFNLFERSALRYADSILVGIGSYAADGSKDTQGS